nr:hypothetical protein [Tanacetum cinerariifolium]
MASFNYCLNPIYPLKECSSCGALYTTDYCCSEGSLRDKIICDLNKTPDLSQRPPQNCPKCGNPVDGQYCQGCALLRKKFKKDLFTYCIKNGILKDAFEPSNDNTNVVYALQEPFVVNQDPGAHYGYNCPSKVPIIPNPKPCHNQTVDELLQTLPSFDPTCYSEYGNSFTYDSRSNLVNDSPNVFNPPSQPPTYSYEFCRNDAYYGHDCPLQDRPTICYNHDDDEDYTIAITPNEPDNSLSMGDEHLDTILATKSDELIKSSVENLVPNPSESEGEHECDVPACEDFTTFSNILFDADYDFSSSDDQSISDEDIPKEIYSNPFFDEEIISMKIDPHHLMLSLILWNLCLIIILRLFLLLQRLILFLMSLPVNSLFSNQFHQELIKLIVILRKKLVLPKDCCMITHLLVHRKNLFLKIMMLQLNLSLHFLSSLRIVTLSWKKLIYLLLWMTLMPPGIDEDDYDSKRDILIFEEFLSNDSLSLFENESFYFDISSSSRPPAKPLDGNSGILNVKVMGDISEHKVPMPRIMLTLVPSQEKSHNLLSHQGHEASQPFTECPMMIYERNTPILDILFLHFYPP